MALQAEKDDHAEKDVCLFFPYFGKRYFILAADCVVHMR